MLLGVLGGLGPLATVYFMDLLVKMTDAESDQNHIPTLVMNDSDIPDRTDYILGKNCESPLPKLEEDAKMLEKCGCDYIVIPCNTAHYFYDEVQEQVHVPIINILEETVKYAYKRNPNIKSIGIMATDGTLKTGSYKKYLDKYGLKQITLSPENNESLMNIIYNQVKAGKKVDMVEFMRLVVELIRDGSDVVILGCTELSIINHNNSLTSHMDYIVDSMDVLAEASIRMCGKHVKENYKACVDL
ncbi:MAG: aspartate/glutamate racemase family protein [Eubacterium sp.]|nr:aspartate/glutamate racemase family protein [Eubacterium sp.]